ncbi:MAG: hypothetical protein SH856_06770 [Flavobacteriales bacterium]|nr:hypothetical protein [Flavobacteriales bacterium]
MKKILIAIILSQHFNVLAQYSYFSNLYESPEYDVSNSGVLWNLFVVDSNLWCIGAS